MKAAPLPVPAAVLDQHVIALGKTGSGKSSKMRVLIEDLLRRGERVTIIDVKGDWWGLKSSADGKGSGFPIVIFGGKHADVPLAPGSGRALAEMLNTANLSCLIDLRGWRPTHRTQFFIDFMDATFDKTEGKRFIMIAEVQNFAPKGKVLSPQAGEMLYWANRLASEGRGLGLTLLADSQRPQKVHNDLLTSCETLIACKVIHKSDRQAVEDWIDGCADPELGKQVVRELASMKRPDSWVWSPEIEFGPKRVAWPLFRTFDSFKPQEAASAGKLKGWAEIDLEQVRAKMATAIAEAQANDPAQLRKQISELQRALKAKRPTADLSVGTTSAELNTARRTHAVAIKRLRGVVEDLMKFVVKISATGFAKDAGVDPQDVRKSIDAAVGQVKKMFEANIASRDKALEALQRDAGRLIASAQKLLTDEPIEIAVEVKYQQPFAIATPRQRLPTPASDGSHNGEIGAGGKRRILIALAQNPEGVTKRKLSILVDIAKGGGTWRTYMAELRGLGYMAGSGDESDLMRITNTGLAALGDYEPLPTGDDLIAYWRDRLGDSGKRKIFDIVVAHPDGLPKEDVAEQTNIALGGGTWRTYLAELRGLELIEGRDELKPNPDLF